MEDTSEAPEVDKIKGMQDVCLEPSERRLEELLQYGETIVFFGLEGRSEI